MTGLWSGSKVRGWTGAAWCGWGRVREGWGRSKGGVASRVGAGIEQSVRGHRLLIRLGIDIGGSSRGPGGPLYCLRLRPAVGPRLETACTNCCSWFFPPLTPLMCSSAMSCSSMCCLALTCSPMCCHAVSCSSTCCSSQTRYMYVAG